MDQPRRYLGTNPMEEQMTRLAMQGVNHEEDEVLDVPTRQVPRVSRQRDNLSRANTSLFEFRTGRLFTDTFYWESF